MLSVFLISFLLYCRRILTYVEPFLLSPKNTIYKNHSKIFNNCIKTNQQVPFRRKYSSLTSAYFDKVEGQTPSYLNSEHYKRLRNYFNPQEKQEEDTEYRNIKEEYVKLLEGGELYAPITYTVECLSAVPELFHENFLRRGEDHWAQLMQIRQKYKKKNEILSKIKELNINKTRSSKLYRSEENPELRDKNILLRNELRELNRELDKISQEIYQLKGQLPNLLSNEVPNREVVKKEKLENLKKEGGVPHYEILERLSGNYIERAVEISGRGFSAYSGDVARLSRALVNLMLDTFTQVFNYKEVNVPLIVSKSTLENTAHLPRFEDHLFKIDSCQLFNGEIGYLIPTSEVPLVALNKNQKINKKELPILLTGYSECFRSEIQDYGLETRGIIRQHQFGKVELICLCEAENSEHMHQLMISQIEFLLNLLELPHRQVLLSEKETGNTSSKTVDFEVYFPSLNNFVEVSSCSNTRDYQTNNLNLQTTSRKKIHCINGSGLAIGRTLSAILENKSEIRENGLLQLNIPKPLQPYLNNDTVILEKVKAN